ncbi:ras guanine nucleotide exchange factor domain-containing protein [Abortiporus biennis]|nr:ras guanine nucleotide exchange factor domain-containing protein [Abortiporus biennis]
MKVRRAESAKRYLPRLSIDSTPYSYLQTSISASPSSSISSAHASIATSTDTPLSTGVFYVLCLYDFQATDADQLSFRKNEILEIVRQEESGWWAALREDEQTVGWIPSAYVEPVSEDIVDKMRSSKNDPRVRIHDSPADRMMFSPGVVSALGSPFALSPYAIMSPGEGMRGFDWLPMGNHGKVNTRSPAGRDIPKDVTWSALSPSSAIGVDEIEEEQVLDMPPPSLKPYPPSPSTPMPQPPTQPPTQPQINEHCRNGLRSVPVRSNSTPLPQTSSPSSSPSRSRSDSANVLVNRHLRRRPVLIDNNSSLSRLSTLFESSNVEEIDFLARSPVVAESIDAYSRARNQSPRKDALKHIDNSQSSPVNNAPDSPIPSYLRPDFTDKDIKLDSDGVVVAGTLPALVERLTLNPLNSPRQIQYCRAFLMTYKTFATADELFEQLLKRYNLQPPSGLTTSEADDWKERKLLPSQKRVLGVFMSWLEHHGLVQDDPPIARRLQEFLAGVTSPIANKLTAKQVMHSLERQTFAVATIHTPLSSPPKRKRSKSGRMELLKTDPALLAEHLCLYEAKLYANVRPQQCLNYVKKQESSSDLHAFCSTHDKLATWVKSSILYTESVGKRADTVDHWIKVAEKCRATNNFSSLSAITTGLSSAVISRLHLTWAHVGRASHLDTFIKLNEPQGNFSAYRTLQQEVDGPCVPFLTMHLTEITHINDQFLDDTIITSEAAITTVNFLKRRKWCEVITTMLRHQGKHYTFTEDPMTTNFLESNLAAAAEIDPSTFWDKSQEVQQAEMATADIRRGLEAAGF